MAEYIERERIAMAVLGLTIVDPMVAQYADAVLLQIQQAPAADVVEVRRGRWESVKNPQWPAYSHDKCSICGWWNTKNALCYDGHNKPGHRLNYCPNCGARMDGE